MSLNFNGVLTKISNISNQEGDRLGFRTTTATRATIIGNLKNAIENDDVYVPSAEVIQELKDYVVNDQGKAEAAAGCHDDYVMSFAIALEVLRSHYDRITVNTVPWHQKFEVYEQEETTWL